MPRRRSSTLLPPAAVDAAIERLYAPNVVEMMREKAFEAKQTATLAGSCHGGRILCSFL